ncbi:hypothetical protein [Metamycoplasma alkalescens]|uniref:hypothetical protein n=1 Tax=Metamycoplasma alkalescens TaxID=45363 RepID=UPI003CFD3C35
MGNNSSEKSTLEKYYIAEKFDENRNISFNIKKANEKISGNFKDFSDALLEFIRISEKTNNETRVWFHRDGAYRGSVNVKKAYIILDRLKGSNIRNEEVIEYIDRENLVDKPVPKKLIPVSNINDEAKKTRFFVENPGNKKISDVRFKDIKWDSRYQVYIEKVTHVNQTIVIAYHLINGNQRSDTFEYKITGFVEHCECKSCECCQKEAMALKTKREKEIFWTFFIILLLLTLANVILIVLRITNQI